MAIDPNFTPKTSTFKPMDWDSIAIPVNSISDGSITANAIKYDYNLPGALLNYTMKYEHDSIHASGLPADQLHDIIKKEMAVKLAQQMMDDGHVVFTKQSDPIDNSIRFRAHTWVGNKDFIEQQRKNKR